MEKLYEYNIQFANERDNVEGLDLINAIEPNNSWHTISISLKSVESAFNIIDSFEKNAIKFTRFWKIIRIERKSWHEEVVARSPQLVIYDKDEAIKQDNFIKSQISKMENINKMDTEFVIEEDFYGDKIIIKRSEAIYDPGISKDIKYSLNIKFIPHIAGETRNLYLFEYFSENKRLLKKKFFENFINNSIYTIDFIKVTKTESDALLEKIKNTFDEINNRIKNI